LDHQNRISIEIKKLLGAAAHSNFPEGMKAYKALFSLGPPVLPQVKETLFGLDLPVDTQLNWRSVVQLRYISTLISLIHDIDEQESKDVTDCLIQKGCSQVLIQRLKSIRQFTVGDFHWYELVGVQIFEHKDIQTNLNIRILLKKWLNNIPVEDLQEIERVYVVHRSEDQDYAGTYTPIYYNVKLVWDATSAKFNPKSWLERIGLEMVFYHEIGHHVHRHTFGQEKKQEEEADAYSSKIFFQSRPALYRILLFLARITKFVRTGKMR
jgi:hypothetical protein